MKSVETRLFLLLACLFLLLGSREPPWADAHVVYDTTESFVEHHDFHVRLEGGPSWFYARPEGPKGVSAMSLIMSTFGADAASRKRD